MVVVQNASARSSIAANRVRDTLIEIRAEDGAILADKTVGKVWMQSPSVMQSYYGDPESTDACIGRRLVGHRRHGIYVG